MAVGFQVEIFGSAARAIKSFNDTERGATKLQGKLSGLGKTLGLTLGTAAVLKFGKDSIKAFGESERASAEMANTIANNPKLLGENVAGFQKLASAIQAKTAADDESVLSAASVLGNFNLTGKQIRDVLPLVVDYARKTGQDVPSAAQTIGKAMLGNARALKGLGINFKSTGDTGKDFAKITDLVRSKVGGFAEKEGKTSAGRLAILKNRFNDVQEVVGGKLIGTFDFLMRNMNTLGPVIAAVVAGLVAYKIAAGFVAVANAVIAASGAGMTIALGPVFLVTAAIIGLGAVVFKFRDQIGAALGQVRDFFVNIFNGIVGFFRRWGPLILTVALGPIGALLTNFGGFRDKVLGIFRGVRDGIVGAFRFVKDVIGGIWNGIVGIVRTGVNGVIHFINGVITGLNKMVDAADVALGPFINLPSIPKLKTIPALAEGGVVRRPTLAMIGEAGPEAVIPLDRVGGGGGNVTIINHFHGSVVTEGELTDRLRDNMLAIRRRNGNVGLA